MPLRGPHFTYPNALAYLVACGLRDQDAALLLYSLKSKTLHGAQAGLLVYPAWDVQAAALKAGCKAADVYKHLSKYQAYRHKL